MEPDNGWGHADTAYNFWHWVMQQCLAHPLGTLRMWG
jgi:hypothetical protein